MPTEMRTTSANPVVGFSIYALPLSIQLSSPDGHTLWVNRLWGGPLGVTSNGVAGYNQLEDQQLVGEGIAPHIQIDFAGEPVPILYDSDETVTGLTGHEKPERWNWALIYPARNEGTGTYARWS